MNINKDGNFVKIDRKILQWGWYRDISTKVLFFHCILMANWKPGMFQGMPCGRGQFITSLASLSKETGLSIQQVRTAFKHLEATGEITRTALAKFTVITVKNYDLYQADNRNSNRQLTGKGQAANKLLTTIEERKEREEGKKYHSAAPQTCPSGISPDYDPEPGTDYMFDYYKQRGGI